ncbi:YciI family protein [Nocardia araoensis]|uniref:YciI family protein n=1 Tax=Nocardia araoensis TaxID=228600 RepID=UPI0002DF56F0|nr:YciI family protein [Nocardia araoensis]
MKHYLLGIYQPDEGEPANLDEIMRDLAVLNDEMRAAGAWVFAAGLHAPGSATVLHARGDDVLITDGPYIEGKEHIGGFTVIRAADLDEALEWGRKLTTVVGLPVEVRPIRDE